jgi:uncharacterized protein (TIGR02145 family)
MRLFNRQGLVVAVVVAVGLAGCGGDSGNGVGSSGGTLSDSRDGQSYSTVTKGDQTWMTENLNIDLPGSRCVNNDASLCDQYGRLYLWNTAINACPSGWHLPTLSEYEQWFAYASDNNSTDNAIIITNDFGRFTKQLGGAGIFSDVISGMFLFVGVAGYWWTASSAEENKYYNWIVIDAYKVTTLLGAGEDIAEGTISAGSGSNGNMAGYSVRCAKD